MTAAPTLPIRSALPKKLIPYVLGLSSGPNRSVVSSFESVSKCHSSRLHLWSDTSPGIAAHSTVSTPPRLVYYTMPAFVVISVLAL